MTPTGLWHEHGHEGSEPVVWLDVLDLPLVYYMESSYHIEGLKQTVKEGSSSKRYVQGGVVPTYVFQRNKTKYPMLRYSWAETKASLEKISIDFPSQDFIQVTYINPETGEDAENILGFYAQMLRPGQTVRLPIRSPAQVFHLIEGEVSVKVVDQKFILKQADTCCAPGYEEVILSNLNNDQAAFIFIADESPLHRKLGLYENRG